MGKSFLQTARFGTVGIVAASVMLLVAESQFKFPMQAVVTQKFVSCDHIRSKHRECHYQVETEYKDFAGDLTTQKLKVDKTLYEKSTVGSQQDFSGIYNPFIGFLKHDYFPCRKLPVWVRYGFLFRALFLNTIILMWLFACSDAIVVRKEK